MCLAIPAKVTEIKEDNLAQVDILGVTRDISLDLTPQAKLGNYVLVHAGFAIEVVDETYAEETLDLIREFPELAGDEVSDLQASVGKSSNPLIALADDPALSVGTYTEKSSSEKRAE